MNENLAILDVDNESVDNEEADFDDTSVVCDKCGYSFDEEDIVYFDDAFLCSECIDEHTFTCESCGKRSWCNEGYHDDNHDVCERCYENYYTSCAECSCIMPQDDACYAYDDEYSDEPYCSYCYSKNAAKIIKSYNYKPKPRFYGSGLFFGVELEIDKGGKDTHNAKELLTIANCDDDYIYIKQDGSLNEGLELVSHPCSLDYHVNNVPWANVMKTALSLGYRSHDTDTAGLHIHVGRYELAKTPDTVEDVIGRVLFFIERHWDKLLKFSRRTEAAISRWASRYGLKENPKDTLKGAKNNYSRYVCLNLQNYSTIEFRMFRGTLRYSTFLATLQLVNEICRLAMELSDEEFQILTWDKFTGGIDTGTKKELIDYLKQRRLYANY